MTNIATDKNNMTTDEALDKVRTLRKHADRYEKAVSSSAGPSSQEYISPQRFDHYMRMAQEARDEANRIEAAYLHDSTCIIIEK